MSCNEKVVTKRMHTTWKQMGHDYIVSLTAKMTTQETKEPNCKATVINVCIVLIER